MRKVIVLCHISLDGIAAINSGQLDWISYNEELEKWAKPIVADTDTAVYGRNTYEIMKYWQTVPSDPQATKHELEHAKWIEKVEKVVFSTSLKNESWNNTKIFSSNVKEEIDKLKQKSGKNITVFGSPKLVHALLKLDVVDEIQLSVSPILLGSGTYLFKGFEDSLKLKLLEEKTLKSGVVTLHYEVNS